MTGRKPFSGLVEKMSPESRARAEEKKAALREEMPLAELRVALELTQANLAEVLETDQPAISRLERRTDMMISTLSRFIEAMGGRLDLIARFQGGDVRIKTFGELHSDVPTGAILRDQQERYRAENDPV